MDLTDLANSIKEFITPGSSAIHTTPGQTYGPAVSRTTGVPINFRPLSEGESGLYQNRFTSLLGQILPGQRGEIYIDPTSQDFKDTYKGKASPVIQHEAAHAILEGQLQDPDYNSLALSNPYYRQVASKIDRAGYGPAEVPAYASERDAATRFGIPQNILDLYRQHLGQQLQTINPGLAKDYTHNANYQVNTGVQQ